MSKTQKILRTKLLVAKSRESAARRIFLHDRRRMDAGYEPLSTLNRWRLKTEHSEKYLADCVRRVEFLAAMINELDNLNAYESERPQNAQIRRFLRLPYKSSHSKRHYVESRK